MIEVIILTFLTITTLDTIIKVVNTLIDERKLYKQSGQSAPPYTYLSVIVPQTMFICVGIIMLVTVNHLVINVWLSILIVYLIYLLTMALGAMLITILKSREE